MNEKLGATGRVPRGWLNANDEGEIQIAIAADKNNGVVVIEFGKPVKWLGLDREATLRLANNLIAKASEIAA